MKKLLLSATLLLIFSLAVFASSYFKDISEKDWYFNGVKTASGYGLMNGVSDVEFAPKANLSAAQAVTVAARIHSMYSTKTVPDEFQGYDYYLEYAVKNDIVPDGYFHNTSLPIRRDELAFIIENSLPEHLLTHINSVKSIPDARIGSEYYDGLLKLYNAGILGGFDEYGSFRPDNNLTRAELAVIIDRIINKENRLVQSLTDSTNREAFYLIDDSLMKHSTRSIPEAPSGWIYDFSGDSGIYSVGEYLNVLNDTNDDHIEMIREIYPQFSGKIVLEAVFNFITGKDGARLFFTDNEGNDVFEIYTSGGKHQIKGSGKADTGVNVLNGKNTYKVVIDLDAHSALVYINGKICGTYQTSDSFDGIAALHIATTNEARIKFEAVNVQLYKNYLVNDVFRIESIGSLPVDYAVTGNAAVQQINSNASNTSELQSVKITSDSSEISTVYKAFEKTSGNVCFESYILLPDGANGGYVSLKSGKDTAIKVETKDGYFVCGGKKLRSFSKNIWQLIRIEADTDAGKATVKINGKTVAENISITQKSFDGIEIGFNPDTSSEMWFDDVEVKRLYEYDDYVPAPTPVETDYILSMMVCSLWRNGSHYGWDYISPFDEITPVTGYYDEGSPEAADWEIKFLVDHGFTSQHLCWYAPQAPAKAPIKKPRMIDALHDGYFNAKYSDCMKFSIMWENANYGASDIESFKEHIWKYWCEWYFTDDRYLTIDGKPFLSIYRIDKFYDMCGNNLNTAKELVEFMRKDIKNYGFEDIIVTFSSNGSLKNENVIFKSIGVDTVHAYSRGVNASDIEINKALVDNGFETAQEYGISPIAVASPGLNSFAWNLPRFDYMNSSDFEDLLNWFKNDYLLRFPVGSWQSKMIMFDNWNEFGEGHYLYPAKLGGFGYLDAAANVFSKNNSFDSKVNILPTEAQKRRIGTLYPCISTKLKREQLIKAETPIADTAVITYDFTKPVTASLFSTSNMKDYGYSKEEKAFSFEAVTSDPIMWLGKSTDRKKIVNAGDVDTIHIRIKSGTVSEGKIYFVTDRDRTYDEGKSLKFNINKTDEYVDCYINAKTNMKWSGDICGLRLDPHSVGGAKAHIQLVEFLKYSPEKKPFGIVIDDISAVLAYDEVRHYDEDEVYLSFKHESGIFHLLHASYKWNRFTNVLTLDTKHGKKFTFTVGSDIALVDGKQVKLKKAVEKYDATVVLPLIFLLKEGGYDCIYAPSDKNLSVFVNKRGQERIDSSHKWEISSQNEIATASCTLPLKTDSTYILNYDIKLSYKNAKDVTVSAKITDGVNTFTETAGIVSYSEDFVHMTTEIDVDLKSKVSANGSVSLSASVPFELKNVIIHRRIKPFSIINGDAEGENITAFYNSGPTNDIVVIADPQNSNNKVWYAENKILTGKSWSYIRHNAAFEKGVTYDVEFDIMLISLADGRPVSGTKVFVNPRYYDTARIGIKNPYDHNVRAIENLSSSNEWTHIKCSFTIADTFEESDNFQQEFTVYVEPVDDLGVTFVIDNVSVTVR